MELQFSRTCDYAIRAAIVLADGDRHKAKSLAEAAGIPAAFAPQVLGYLIRSGLADSIAGKSGGYRLSRPADEVSLLHLVEAVEGPLRSTRCVLKDSGCDPDSPCTVHDYWYQAQEALRASMGSASLTTIAKAKYQG